MPGNYFDQPDPYTGLPVGPAIKTTTIVTGDAQMKTRSDLGIAQGGEPGDNKMWLKSLSKKWAPGPCCHCGTVTARRMAYAGPVHIKGRVWGLLTRNDCGCKDVA